MQAVQLETSAGVAGSDRDSHQLTYIAQQPIPEFYKLTSPFATPLN